jgi:hypothetical protein
MESITMSHAARATALAMVAVLCLAATAGAQAQQTMTQTDVDRLELNLKDARADLARLETRDATLAATLRKDLDGIADEVTYLKVKMTKEGSVPRSEYVSLRDRIDDLRGRMETAAPRAAGTPVTIPVGTELDVRLQTELDSGTNQVEDRFQATTLVDISRDGRILVPAGSVMRGVVAAVDKASRADRKGSLTLAFDRITVRDRAYDLKATVLQATEGKASSEVKKIGGAAVAGAIIGGLLGGGKGALIGTMIGGGGMVAATPGSDVKLPVGTVLTVRLDTPLTLQ